MAHEKQHTKTRYVKEGSVDFPDGLSIADVDQPAFKNGVDQADAGAAAGEVYYDQTAGRYQVGV